MIFADRLMTLGFTHACKAGISFGKDDMIIPAGKWEPRPRHAGPGQAVRAAVLGRPDHQGREVQQGGRRLAAVLGQGRRGDDAGDPGRAADQARGRPLPAAERDLDDGAFRCPRLGGADQAAGRHARPDGQALGRDHREPDHLELQGRPDGARVLQLDARRPQGSGRHRARRPRTRATSPAVWSTWRRTASSSTRIAAPSGRSPSRPRAAARIWASASWAGPWPRTSSIRAPARSWQPRNTLLDEELCRNIDRSGVDSVHVRSVLTCDTKTGVCGRCYGRDLARGTTVNIGEAVGVIAAQSIGEPGTQLTMRTFHIGGAAQASAEQAAIESPCVGVVRLVNPRVVRDSTDRPGRPRPQHRDRGLRRGRPREAAPEAAQRHAAAGRSRLAGREGAGAGRVGSAHPAGDHRGLGHHRVPGPDRRHLVPRGDRRGHGQGQQGGDRLAPERSLGQSAAVDRAPGRARQPDHAAVGQRGALLPAGRRHHVGRERPEGAWRATCWPVCRARPARPATSLAVCRGWPSCSRRAGPRTRRSSPRSRGGSSSARTTRTSGGCASCRPTRISSRSST